MCYMMSLICHSCPQFLITTGENLDYLDGVHTVFGEVTEGMDVLTKINETFVDKDFVPFQDIRWTKKKTAYVVSSQTFYCVSSSLYQHSV